MYIYLSSSIVTLLLLYFKIQYEHEHSTHYLFEFNNINTPLIHIYSSETSSLFSTKKPLYAFC